MQSSSEKPAGEGGYENEGVGNEVEQAALPLYEFPADSPSVKQIGENLKITYYDRI